MKNKAVVFLNGELTDADFIKSLVNANDYLIGADGGADHIYKLGYKPNAVVGDFDSIVNLPDKIKNLNVQNIISGDSIKLQGIEYVKYPEERDFTDGQIAIDFAVNQGFAEIIVVCSLGGEIDHVFGNYFLLGRAKYTNKNIKIIQPNLEAFVVSGEVKILGMPGQKISLIPLFGEAKVSSCSGLRYDLTKYKMQMQTNSGISNQFTKEEAKIKITTGKFLVVIHK